MTGLVRALEYVFGATEFDATDVACWATKDAGLRQALEMAVPKVRYRTPRVIPFNRHAIRRTLRQTPGIDAVQMWTPPDIRSKHWVFTVRGAAEGSGGLRREGDVSHVAGRPL
jgi:hypothetical protein